MTFEIRRYALADWIKVDGVLPDSLVHRPYDVHLHGTDSGRAGLAYFEQPTVPDQFASPGVRNVNTGAFVRHEFADRPFEQWDRWSSAYL